MVIAILSLLITLLVPSLREARELAYLAKCGSNLRAVGIGLHMYAGDWNDWMPWSFGTSGVDLAGSGGTSCRLGLLYLQSDQSFFSFPYHCESAGYIPNRDMLDCPSKKYDVAPYDHPYWRKRLAGYSYCIPRSGGQSANYFSFRLDGKFYVTRHKTVTEWTRFAYTQPCAAWVSCWRESGPSPQNGPHRNRGLNTLYRGGAVLFIRRPENGWGTYSWLPDIPENEMGNMYDFAAAWPILHSNAP